MPVIRSMALDDVGPVMELTGATFDDLSRRLGEEPEPPPQDLDAAALRYRTFVTHDPEGSWVAEDEHGLAGCALAVKREGIWGLSLLVVRPGLQSAGVGSELLRRAHAYASDAKGRIIMASPDPRAIRAYARLGLELHPCFVATGTSKALTAPEGFRAGTADDIGFCETVDRFARGGGRRSSIETMLEMGQTFYVLPERGYAFLGDESVSTMAALDDDGAAAVLRGVLSRTTGKTRIGSFTAAQQWAVPVLLEAGLDVKGANGPMFLGGDLGGFRPYLPSGAFL